VLRVVTCVAGTVVMSWERLGKQSLSSFNAVLAQNQLTILSLLVFSLQVISLQIF
jgi:hypothetical protein